MEGDIWENGIWIMKNFGVVLSEKFRIGGFVFKLNFYYSGWLNFEEGINWNLRGISEGKW